MGQVAEAAHPAGVGTDRVWRRLFVLVGLVLSLSYGYFFSGGGWNQASRFDLVRAVVELGTIRIDRYHENTGDKAERDGHYYCDKAPGVSFMALPVVAAARPILKQLGVRTQSNRGLVYLAFLGTFAASGLPTAAGGLALMWLARRVGAKPLPAALAAIAVGLGTPTFAYAVLFWGHATAGACLIGATAAGVAAGDAEAPRRAFALSVLFGLLLAVAVMVEYPAGGAGGLIGFATAFGAYRRRQLPGVARLVGGVLLGAALPLALLLTYQNAAFGSPFALSYSKVEGWEGMQEGFFGVTLPKPAVLAELLAGARRGVLWLAPCLFVAPIGFVLAWKRGGELRLLAAGALAVITFYFLLNASYHYWDGGFTYGPRHVGPALPFLGLGIALSASASRRLLAVSLVLTRRYRCSP
jgi:hypothetical protein